MVIISFTISGINIDAYHGAVSDCALVSVPAVAVLRVTKPRVSPSNSHGAMTGGPRRW